MQGRKDTTKIKEKFTTTNKQSKTSQKTFYIGDILTVAATTTKGKGKNC